MTGASLRLGPGKEFDKAMSGQGQMKEIENYGCGRSAKLMYYEHSRSSMRHLLSVGVPVTLLVLFLHSFRENKSQLWLFTPM